MALSFFSCFLCSADTTTDRACSVGILCGCRTYPLCVGRTCVQAHAHVPKYKYNHHASAHAPSRTYSDSHQHRAREAREEVRQERALDPEWSPLTRHPYPRKGARESAFRWPIGADERRGYFDP